MFRDLRGEVRVGSRTGYGRAAVERSVVVPRTRISHAILLEEALGTRVLFGSSPWIATAIHSFPDVPDELPQRKRRGRGEPRARLGSQKELERPGFHHRSGNPALSGGLLVTGAGTFGVAT